MYEELTSWTHFRTHFDAPILSWLWVEAKATKSNDSQLVLDFLRTNILSKFGVLKAIINDRGTHFYNRTMVTLLNKYVMTHIIATPYHPQTNKQAKVFNREVNIFFAKSLFNHTRRIEASTSMMLHGFKGRHTKLL